MKWIGALLLIGVTTWTGFEWSKNLNDRPKHIRQLKSALQMLEAEILYSQVPLREAFRIISKQIPYPTQFLFQTLYESMEQYAVKFFLLWERQVKQLVNISALGKNELEILKQFGQTLGQHDFTQQQKHIQLAIHHLERELEEAKDDQYKYAKMAKSLGFLGGLFLVILFI